jgi:trans-aconitate 2-methyltransferase
MPANFDHPSHLAAAELATEEPFRTALGGYRRDFPVLAPEDYSLLLWELGYTRQHVALRVFLHVLESADAVEEWVKGTLLTDYEKRLTPELYQEFLVRYRGKLVDVRPYPYAFKRILLWGLRPGHPPT